MFVKLALGTTDTRPQSFLDYPWAMRLLSEKKWWHHIRQSGAIQAGSTTQEVDFGDTDTELQETVQRYFEPFLSGR